MRFASVYRPFSSIEDFEKETAAAARLAAFCPQTYKQRHAVECGICECRCGAPGWRTARLGVGDPV